MCNSRLIILFVVTFLMASAIFAQQPFNYSFRHITQADGLLHNEVLSIAQDGKGFIWIGTKKGVQRFDGLRFLNYSDTSDTPGESNSVTALYPDNNNSIWLVKNFQVKQLQLLRNEFSIVNTKKILQHGGEEYTAMDGNIWVLQPNYMHQSHIKRKKTAGHILLSQTNNDYPYFTPFTKDTLHNQTWINSQLGLLLFDDSSRKIFSQDYNPIFHPLLWQLKGKKYPIRNITIDSKQNIWITTWGPILLRYNIVDQQLYTYSIADYIKSVERKKILTGSANIVLEDNHGVVWLGTTNAGLLQYDPQKDNFNYTLYQQGNFAGIHYNYEINSLFQDKEQNIWVGTDKGISIFNPYLQYFTILKNDQYNAQSLPKNQINAMIQVHGGDLLLGTWGGGISVFDSKLCFKKNITFTDSIQKNEIWCFTQNDDGTIWSGCQQGYIHILAADKMSFQTIHPPEMENSTIRCIVKDGTGNMWFGLHNGKIVHWNKENKKFQSFGQSSTNDSGPASPITNMFIDKSGNFWVSTWKGFRQFDTGKRIFISNYKSNRKDNTTISSSYCMGIEEYNDSTLLVGTQDGGINLFNKKRGTFSLLKTADDLLYNTIYAIKKDAAGYVWFTTDYGLYKFNPGNKKVIPYSIGPVRLNSSFVSNNFYPLQDGQWLIFTDAEAISFFPHKAAYPDNLKTKIEITGFKLFEKHLFVDSLLYENKPIHLSYKENFFTIEFAALIFSGQQQTNYYYRLNGVDKDWVNVGTNRFASYTGVQPGEYTFEVKAENNNSRGEVTSFKIIITPPWWKTWWFISLAVFSILLLTFLLIKWREKNIKIIAEEKLKVQQLDAGQYKSKLEMELIINYFSSSLLEKNTEDDVLWDVAKNLIGRLGFVDCMIYLWNDDKTKMIQKAGFGPKGSIEAITNQHFDVVAGQGVVGYVMETKEPVLITDTSKDIRYRADEMTRLSEITVPIIYNNELIGVIDSEHHEKKFFTQQHQQIMTTIATLMANKIKSIEAEQSLQQTNIEMYSMNEQLSKAKLEALQNQMNPHFIFNCINSIDALIQSNDKYHATVYLNKFAKLIRNILDSSKQDTIPLTKDLETLKLYIEMEQFRHENKFIATIQADDALLQDDYKVPPLIVQPFVENAILHGLRNKEGNEGILTVEIKKVGDKIQYNITDNGIGRKAAGEIMQNKESHYGMQMSYDRIKLFNKENTASVQVIDLYNNNIPAGTKVKVDLNII